MFAECDDSTRDNRRNVVACSAALITYLLSVLFLFVNIHLFCIDGSGHVSIHVRHDASAMVLHADKKWITQYDVTVWVGTRQSNKFIFCIDDKIFAKSENSSFCS